MATKEGEGSVDKLREELYSSTSYEAPDNARTPIPEGEVQDVEGKWQDSPDLDKMLQYERRKPENNYFMKKVLLGAFIFFVAAGILAAYAIFGGAGFISSKNVEIEIQAPLAVSAGEVIDMEISITNKNNASLKVANLSIQYPQGTRSAEDPTESLTYVREELGSIGVGREIIHNARAILFGTEGEVKEIKISIEYEVEGSSATFYKDKVYEIGIGDSPVSIKISQPETVTSGDTFTTTIDLSSNSTETIRNVVLRGEYPYGFSVVSSSPSPSGDGNLWILGDLAPGSKKTVTIDGQLLGENSEERTFRYYVGVADARDSTAFGTSVSSATETIGISRPSVALQLEFNGNPAETYTVPAGRSLNVMLRFENNLPDRIVNPRLEVRLTGEALDKTSVSPQHGGFYNSQTDTIVWDIAESIGETDFKPGDRDSVSFSLESLDEIPPGSKPEISLTATLTGTSVGGSSRQISVRDSGFIRISSQASLTSKTLYSTGPFENSGPIPPVAEQATTYTLLFSLGNTQNDIDDAQLTATLGPGVEWVEASTNQVSYNEASRKITWDMGTLDSGAGFSSPRREAAVQVRLAPSLSQVGTAPTLAAAISFRGTDEFTGQVVSVINSNLTTNMSSDPIFVQGDDRVVRQ